MSKCICILAALHLGAFSVAQAGQVTVQLANAAGQPVTNAAAYATLLSGSAPARPKRDIAIEQFNKEFVPLVSIIQAGTMVNFPNRDKIRHHVYSFSPAKTFEIKLYSGVLVKPVAFEKPGEVVLGCNIHDSMIAYVLVVDTPFFAKTDGHGRVLLDNLPAGEYEVNMWYPGATDVPASQKIKVGATEKAVVRFTYNFKPLTAGPGAGK